MGSSTPTADQTPGRTVRVVCRYCDGAGRFHDVSLLGSDGLRFDRDCHTCKGAGVTTETLRDPDAEALMADGERARSQIPEALAILESGTDYERLHVSAILRAALTPPPSGAAPKEGEG